MLSLLCSRPRCRPGSVSYAQKSVLHTKLYAAVCPGSILFFLGRDLKIIGELSPLVFMLSTLSLSVTKGLLRRSGNRSGKSENRKPPQFRLSHSQQNSSPTAAFLLLVSPSPETTIPKRTSIIFQEQIFLDLSFLLSSSGSFVYCQESFSLFWIACSPQPSSQIPSVNARQNPCDWRLMVRPWWT